MKLFIIILGALVLLYSFYLLVRNLFGLFVFIIKAEGQRDLGGTFDKSRYNPASKQEISRKIKAIFLGISLLLVGSLLTNIEKFVNFN